MTGQAWNFGKPRHCPFQKSSALDSAELRGLCRGLLTRKCSKSRAQTATDVRDF